MQVKKTADTETQTTLSVIAGNEELRAIKEQVLGLFQRSVKIQGFREGKAPLNLVEKAADQNQLQSAFLEEAINQLYVQVMRSESLRPVANPEISIKKFVPFTVLEFEAKVAVLGEIKLPDYKKIKKSRPKISITAKDVTDVLRSLQQRLAEKKDVDRAAKTGDHVWIDFRGTDAKGAAINGADGKDYPLLIGSKTFIPGFEDNIIGLKAGQSKEFILTFPKDYGVKALAGKKVTFNVDITKVQEVIEPKLDDVFAAQAGPFKTLKELKEDIRKQLTHERQQQADRDYESDVVREVAQKTKLAVPETLIANHTERLMQELRQNLTYRGQTYQEFLDGEDKTDEQYRKQVLVPQAEERVKAGLILAEIAELENLDVTPEEVEIRMQLLKAQYQDAAMQAELEKPETRQDIASRLLTEKVVKKLADYAAKP